MRKRWIALGLLVALLLGGLAAAYILIETRVRIEDYPRPVAVESAPQEVDGRSVIVTSIGLPLSSLRRGLEQDVPRRLWAVDEQRDNCVPRREIKVFGERLGRTPKVKCRITGEVRRGAIRVSGRGDRLLVTLPVTSTVHARDIGGVIKQETATASAVMEISARLTVDRNWRVRSDVDLDYRWTREPGIDILGQRVTFTKPANRELRRVLREVERSLQREIDSLAVKPEVEPLWQQGFTIVSLSRENPPVWLTIAPQEVGLGRLRVEGDQLKADVLVAASTQVHVGERPAEPQRSPLSANAAIEGDAGFRASVPVSADFAQLEPVVLRELSKLAEKGITQEKLGRIELAFESVEIFATEGGKLAVGIVAEAEPIGNVTGRTWGRSKGEVWLTGRPVTQDGSQIVRIEDLHIFGDMDRASGDLLIRIMQREDIRAAIEAALVEDFRKDYARILERVRSGLANVEAGQARFAFTLDSVEHGAIQVTGQGLYMPVEARGSIKADVRVR